LLRSQVELEHTRFAGFAENPDHVLRVPASPQYKRPMDVQRGERGITRPQLDRIGSGAGLPAIDRRQRVTPKSTPASGAGRSAEPIR
jgi:hypothetical protein